MKENNISRLIKCQQCEKLFYNNADAKAHKTRVHEYGEFYNLYPCKECGFMGGDATEIEEHSRNHRQYRTKTVKANTEKSNENFNISHGDIVVDNDSDADEDWEQTKEDEKLLQDDLEEDDFFTSVMSVVLKRFLKTNLINIRSGSTCLKEKERLTWKQIQALGKEVSLQ